MKTSYNRYEQFTVNGSTRIIPFIKIYPKSTDKVYKYRQGKDRLDRISNDYYGNPYHGWLILLANPQFGGNEFAIEDGEIIRIPFPLRDSIQQYIQESKRYVRLNVDISEGENI